LLKGKNTLKSGQAGGISAAPVISCIRSNRIASFLTRFVLKLQKSLPLNISKVRFRLAAS
jgi:hypothetical protein